MSSNEGTFSDSCAISGSETIAGIHRVSTMCMCAYGRSIRCEALLTEAPTVGC